jgi:hypothetical protein
MTTIPDVEERIRTALHAKYARDQRWDFFGYLVVRGLILPGCAACRASADLGTRELAFLLHEHINDAELVVGLIGSNGFCRRHCARAREHVARNYEDMLKIVLLYDHLVRSLHRRLGERPREIEPIHPRQGCPICTVERDADAEIVDWVRDGLAVPEIADLYRDSSGLCIHHLSQIPTRDHRLETPIRDALDATRPWLSQGRAVPGPIGERLALFWGGGWHRDQIDEDRNPDCPVCQETLRTERRALSAIADGAPVDTAPCREHTGALRCVLDGRDWPRAIITTLVEHIDMYFRSAPREQSSRWHLPRPFGGRRDRVTAREVSRKECPVCRALDDAAIATVSQVAATELGERGCLAHIAALGGSQPACEPALNVALRSRLASLATQVHAACQFDHVPREARRAELEDLARSLTNLFLPPSTDGAGARSVSVAW